MILTIDIGNTTTLIGGYEGEQLRFTGRCASNLNRTEDEYVLLFRDILDMYGWKADQVEGSILSSVVPALRTVVCRAVERLTGERVLVVVNADSHPYTAHFDAGCGRAVDLLTGKNHDFGGGSELPPYSVAFWRCER